ncbi:MAG: ATP-binding protein [Myxococcota bacterium]
MSILLASLRELCAQSPLLSPEGRALRVLVVEDDDFQAHQLVGILQDVLPNLDVRVATTGVEALGQLQGQDVLILDLKLPDMSGRALLDRARALTGDDAFAVVAMTRRGTELGASEILRAGAHDYVTKESLNPDRLVRALEVSIDLARTRKQARMAYEALEAHSAQLRRETERRQAFVRSVAHDLRSPLQVLSLAGAELMESSIDPEVKESASMVLAAYRRLSRLVESLDSVQQVEGGDIELNLNRADVVRLVERLVEELRGYPRGDLVRIDERSVPRLEALVDRRRLEQVLVHLCVNAMRHAREEVRIELQQGSAGFTLRVMDDGPGVPQEDHERIFLAFDRGKAEERRPGLGLGLSIARSLVGAMGGQLRLEPGNRGAEFVIELPTSGPDSGRSGTVEGADFQSGFAS